MQAELVRLLLNVSGASKETIETIKKEIEILIENQQEIVSFQERNNKKIVTTQGGSEVNGFEPFLRQKMAN